VRVVADSQAIIWYLSRPERLSERALETLGSAEDSDGIVVSSWTVPELWMAATRKRGPNAVDRANYELVRSTLLDADSAVDVEPFGSAMWAHFEVVSTEQEHLQKPSGM
jgi:PIN domain nuclease of toxin-antitoxin system